MYILNLAISNKSSLACTNFSVFKREQIYVLAYSIQIYIRNSILYTDIHTSILYTDIRNSVLYTDIRNSVLYFFKRFLVLTLNSLKLVHAIKSILKVFIYVFMHSFVK